MQISSILPLVGVSVGLMVFCSKRKHLLNTLMSLEFISLNMLILLSTELSKSAMTFFAMFFLVLVVCEGTMGLGLLVSLIRSAGNEMVGTLRLLYP